MNLSVGTPILCVLLVALLSETVYTKPAASPWYQRYNLQRPRYKRLSDQRMAELETLLALEKVKGVVVPIGFGKIDPAVIGRKRRSIISEDNYEKLQHLLMLLAQNTESTADQSPWKEDPREEQRDYQLI